MGFFRFRPPSWLLIMLIMLIMVLVYAFIHDFPAQ
jgi:hypothetical protein